MKNLMLMVSMLIMLSCNTESSKSHEVSKTAEKEKTEQTQEATNAKIENKTPKTDCDIFLDEFELWVVEIEATHKKVKKNRSDNESTQKLLQASQKLVDWQNRWESLSNCADEEKYEERMLDLEDRVNKSITL